MAGKHVMLLKRVVALPGQRVAFRKGVLIVDDKEVFEDYVEYNCDWKMPEAGVGPNELYVVGDNRSMAVRSHYHGRVDRKRIIGGPVF